MDITNKPCFFCGVALTSAKTKGKVYCSASCTQSAHQLKRRTAPVMASREWRDQVIGQVLANKPHPNKHHLANRVLDAIKVKLAEMEELKRIKNQSLNY